MGKFKVVADGVAVLATATCINVAGISDIISIVCLVLTCISILLGMVFKIIDKVKEAKKDGVITADEVKDIVQTGKDGIDEICQTIEDSDVVNKK